MKKVIYTGFYTLALLCSLTTIATAAGKSAAAAAAASAGPDLIAISQQRRLTAAEARMLMPVDEVSADYVKMGEVIRRKAEAHAKEIEGFTAAVAGLKATLTAESEARAKDAEERAKAQASMEALTARLSREEEARKAEEAARAALSAQLATATAAASASAAKDSAMNALAAQLAAMKAKLEEDAKAHAAALEAMQGRALIAEQSAQMKEEARLGLLAQMGDKEQLAKEKAKADRTVQELIGKLAAMEKNLAGFREQLAAAQAAAAKKAAETDVKLGAEQAAEKEALKRALEAKITALTTQMDELRAKQMAPAEAEAKRMRDLWLASFDYHRIYTIIHDRATPDAKVPTAILAILSRREASGALNLEAVRKEYETAYGQAGFSSIRRLVVDVTKYSSTYTERNTAAQFRSSGFATSIFPDIECVVPHGCGPTLDLRDNTGLSDLREKITLGLRAMSASRSGGAASAW